MVGLVLADQMQRVNNAIVGRLSETKIGFGIGDLFDNIIGMYLDPRRKAVAV